ncbi:MAG TPA: hypothetical protein PLJ11_01050 [Methanomassiliicoccales archaeon]|jgi:hypothetical protein|nr:hypothetical protein [Methanomassiliicoccales archaeon]
MPGHAFHEKIGDIVTSIVNKDDERTYCLLSDDCSRKDREGGYHALKIFGNDEDGNSMEYARADLLIVHDGLIVGQVEIEEEDRSPTKLFGKIISSAHSTYYEYKSGLAPKEKGPIKFSDRFKFIQIVRYDKSEYTKESGHPAKWERVERDIKSMLNNSEIGFSSPTKRKIEYKLLFGDIREIEGTLGKIMLKF